MEPEEKTEEQLAAELEAMYKRVASIGKPVEADDQGDEIRVHQPHAEIAPTSTAGAVEKAGSRAAPVPPALQKQPLPEGRYRRIVPGALAATCVFVCVLLYGVIFWPTLYDAASINTDGKMYPLRINRITGSVVYFDGEQWRNTPVPATPGPVAAAPVTSAPLAAQTATLPQKETLPDRRQAPAPSAPQAQTPIQSSSIHQVKQMPPRGAARDSLFAIQIKSFDNPAEARKLVEDLRKTGMEIDSVAAPVGSRGIWNRVLIGRFKDPNEALKFMQEHRIIDAYPDSFIQKRSP
ncbi:MAG: SPOR domain-containing protein [Pseudomonadota bacterium]